MSVESGFVHYLTTLIQRLWIVKILITHYVNFEVFTAVIL
jgi:hypothetical protein